MRFREADAARMAREIYELEAEARELPSERDQNFLLSTGAARFVLKIANGAERSEILDLQDQALAWLEAHAPKLPCPRVQGGNKVCAAGHFVRLFTYLPGTVMAGVKPQTPGLLRDLGRFLGHMDTALEGFSHTAALNRELEWNPDRYLETISRHRSAVEDPILVDHFVKHFETFTVPLLPKLHKSVIQNDANDYNVLVSDPVFGDRSVTGLLDFGDTLHTYTVCEAAVAVAYTMLGKADPLAAAAHVVAGYHQARPLTEAELEALFPLACVRLCLSVCLAAHRRTTQPQNEYLTISEVPAWSALQKLRAIHPRFASYTFRSVCGFAPCPRTAKLVAWLGENRAQFARVVKPDLATGVAFDLSVDSPEMETPEEVTNTPALTRKIFERMKEAGTEVGIGRYNEARLAYQSDAYRALEGEHPEWRTVHIGQDLFLEPDTAVYAAIAGRVRSVRNNAARFDYGPTVILEHDLPGAPPFYTLYGHLTEDSLDELHPGTVVAKGQEIGRIGSPPVNGDWPPHLHFQIIADLFDWSGDFPGVAAPSQLDVWLSVSPDPNQILGIPEEVLGSGRDDCVLLPSRRQRLGPNLSLSYQSPLTIVRGYAQHLYDHTGRRFLDLVNNVAHVGHCHPQVVRAAKRQMAVLNTNTRYLHNGIVDYADRLCATLPEPLRVCFFVNSGSEANELALRLARAHTRSRGVIVLEGAYHGNTSGLVEVSPYKFNGPGGEGRPPHVAIAPVPDDYRGRYRRDDPDRSAKYAGHVYEAVREMQARKVQPAAFLCESLLSVAGQVVLPPGYLAAAYGHVREAGAVCIVDEVQVGFGRVGTSFWAFETQGVVPDILTLGKPIGNGHPLAAVVTTPEIAASFNNGMEYFNTFGGNAVSCAIGMAVLDVMRDEDLQNRALELGVRLKSGIDQLASKHPIIGDVRGLGLFLGFELVRHREKLTPATQQASYVVERMKDHGILVTTEGPLHNVVKIKPPLVISESDVDRFIEVLDKVLGEDFCLAIRGTRK